MKEAGLLIFLPRPPALPRRAGRKNTKLLKAAAPEPQPPADIVARALPTSTWADEEGRRARAPPRARKSSTSRSTGRGAPCFGGETGLARRAMTSRRVFDFALAGWCAEETQFEPGAGAGIHAARLGEHGAFGNRRPAAIPGDQPFRAHGRKKKMPIAKIPAGIEFKPGQESIPTRAKASFVYPAPPARYSHRHMKHDERRFRPSELESLPGGFSRQAPEDDLGGKKTVPFHRTAEKSGPRSRPLVASTSANDRTAGSPVAVDFLPPPTSSRCFGARGPRVGPALLVADRAALAAEKIGARFAAAVGRGSTAFITVIGQGTGCLPGKIAQFVGASVPRMWKIADLPRRAEPPWCCGGGRARKGSRYEVGRRASFPSRATRGWSWPRENGCGSAKPPRAAARRPMRGGWLDGSGSSIESEIVG